MALCKALKKFFLTSRFKCPVGRGITPECITLCKEQKEKLIHLCIAWSARKIIFLKKSPMKKKNEMIDVSKNQTEW